MPSNPFKRKQSPLDEARERISIARTSLADSARGVRDAADKVAGALDDSSTGKRVPLIGASAAAALGVAYAARKRLGLANGDKSEPVATTPAPTANAGGKAAGTPAATPPAGTQSATVS